MSGDKGDGSRKCLGSRYNLLDRVGVGGGAVVVVRVLAHDDEGDEPYTVLELIEGPDLCEYLARSGPLPCRQVLQIGTQIADALDTALALDVDGQGRYHLAGYSCFDTCEPVGEVRVYAPGGKLVAPTASLGPLGSA